jgi:hypothetical protein
MGRWTQRARELEARSGNTPDTPDTTSSVGFVGTSANGFEEEIAWRAAAFRARIPAHGPIWPPRIRNTSDCDTSGHCSLCGDMLPTDPAPRFPRCMPCVHALWLAIHEVREGLLQTREGAP